MKAPKTSKEITQEWLEFIFTEYERRTHPQAKVQLESYEMSDGCKKGEGYNSVIVKLDAKATILNEDTKDNTYVPQENEYHVIIKFGTQDPLEKGMYDAFRLYQRELLIYTDMIDELKSFQFAKAGNELGINIPKFFYGQCSDKNFVMVLENMKEDYYEIVPRDKFLNFEQAKTALSQLAWLHAVSYVYNKDKNVLENFPCLNKYDHFKSILLMGYTTCYDMIISYLKNKPDLEPLLKKIKTAKSSIMNDCNKIFKEPDGSCITCLNHGDTWNNNILIKDCVTERNDNDESDGVCLIDWQNAHWGTSAYDVHYFIAGSTSPELRSEHLDNLLQHYHVSFTEVTNKLGSPVPNWGYEQFKNEYDRLYAWGFLKRILFSLMLSDASKELVTGDKHGTLHPFLMIGKTILAKILTPVLVTPFAVNLYFASLMGPIKKELISEKTPHFNSRFIDTLLEAENMGIFDKSRGNTNSAFSL